MSFASARDAGVLSLIACHLQKRMFAADVNNAFHSTTRLAAVGSNGAS